MPCNCGIEESRSGARIFRSKVIRFVIPWVVLFHGSFASDRWDGTEFCFTRKNRYILQFCLIFHDMICGSGFVGCYLGCRFSINKQEPEDD